MRSILAFALVLVSFTSQAFVSDCNPNTALKCTVNYYSLGINGSRQVQTLTSASHFQLENWDEPSLAFCQALVNFNQNGVFISASLNEQNLVSVGVTRSSSTSFSSSANDYFASSAKIDNNGEFKASVSLASALPASNVYGLEVTCNVLK